MPFWDSQVCPHILISLCLLGPLHFLVQLLFCPPSFSHPCSWLFSGLVCLLQHWQRYFHLSICSEVTNWLMRQASIWYKDLDQTYPWLSGDSNPGFLSILVHHSIHYITVAISQWVLWRYGPKKVHFQIPGHNCTKSFWKLMFQKKKTHFPGSVIQLGFYELSQDL